MEESAGNVMTEEEEFEFRARLESEQKSKPVPQQQTLKQGMTEQSAESPVTAFNTGIANASTRVAAGLGKVLPQALSKYLPTQKDVDLLEAGSEGSVPARVGQIGMDVAATAPLMGGKLLTQAAKMGGYGAATADKGQELQGAALGAGATAAAPVIGGLVRATGRGASNILGLSSGGGAESVRQAFKDAPGFVENLRGKAPAHEVVDQAKAGIAEMRDQMKARYANAKGGWANDTTPLSMDPIVSAADNVAAKYSFKGIPQPGADDVHGRVTATIRDWQQNAASDPAFVTVEGLDALKRHLQDIVPTSVENRTGRAYVTEVTNAVKDAITNQVPQYKAAMRDYWSSSKELDEITRSLSLGDRGTTDAALRKLQTLTKAPGHTGTRRESARLLAEKGGEDVLPAIAGQNLSSWTPSGLRAMAGFGGGLMTGNPLVTALASPRIVGEATRYAGKAMRSPVTQATLEALRRGSPAAIRAVNQTEE